MDYRDILVLMDSTPAGRYRAKFGADLAQRWKAHLTGVFLTCEFILQFGSGESLFGLPASDIDGILKTTPKASRRPARSPGKCWKTPLQRRASKATS